MPLTEARKRLVLTAAILGTTVVTLDSSVVNVALPAIADDLGGGLAGQQWTANAYLVTLGSLLLIGGSLGDIFGERRVYAIGVAAFGVTSLFCALAPTIELLVLSRALQGVAGAVLTPAALAVIVSTFPPAERGKAVGAWTAWGGIGAVLGPLVGGQLVDVASWRWIFAINVPLVLVTMLLILRVVPQGRPRDDRAKVDVVGAALCAFGLAGMTFGLIEQPLRGWDDPAVFGTLIGGAVLFASFLVWETRTPAPMLPLGLFRRRNFAVGNIQTFSMYGGLGLLFFFLVLYLQQVAGYDALEAGATSLPVTLVMFGLSTRFGMLADRYGPRFFMGVGPLIAALGLASFAFLDADVDYLTELLPGLLVFGVGLSITVAPLTATVLADADESNAGVASGVNNAIARVASLVAIAAVGAVVAAHFGATLDEKVGAVAQGRPAVARAIDEARNQPLADVSVTGVPPRVARAVDQAAEDASISSFRLGMWISTALVALGGLLGLVGIVNPRRRVEAEDCGGGQLVGVPREGGEPVALRLGRGTGRVGADERELSARTGCVVERCAAASGHDGATGRARRLPPAAGIASPRVLAPSPRVPRRLRRRRRGARPAGRRPRRAARRLVLAHQDRPARAAVGGARQGAVPEDARLRHGAAGLQHALRRRAARRGRAAARRARRAGGRALGAPLRRAHRGQGRRPLVRRLLDARERRRGRPLAHALDPRRHGEQAGDDRRAARS